MSNWQHVSYSFAPVGKDAANPGGGDIILCHRKGFSSGVIRFGEGIKYRKGNRWSHVACVIASQPEPLLIEALTHGVKKTPLSHYRDIEYVLARTSVVMDSVDRAQVVNFWLSCERKKYGFLTDFGLALRFCTPGENGLYFGMDGTEICSGMAAQGLVRSWFNFSKNPASLSPAQLAIDIGVPETLEKARTITGRGL